MNDYLDYVKKWSKYWNQEDAKKQAEIEQIYKKWDEAANEVPFSDDVWEENNMVDSPWNKKNTSAEERALALENILIQIDDLQAELEIIEEEERLEKFLEEDEEKSGEQLEPSEEIDDLEVSDAWLEGYEEALSETQSYVQGYKDGVIEGISSLLEDGAD